MLIAQHRRSPGLWTILAFVLLLCYGCGGSSAPDDSNASESGRLVLRLSPAATPQRAQQLRPFSPLQLQAGDIDALRITVASEALAAPLVFDCDLSAAASGPCEVTETPTEFVIAIEIMVPRNADLVVTVTIFNENGDATFEGTRTIRLTQGMQVEDIVLAPVDNDGDGFSEAQGDCDDTNAAIRPGAIEIPGNGIDEDCDGVDAPVANTPPVANAGPDQTVPIGVTVTLTGHRSSDVDGDRLSFRWLLLDLPANSTAELFDPATITPTFMPDLDGDYIVQLIVNDGTVDSAADTVTIRTSNSKPVANAGPDQTAQVNTTVRLDGTASSDVDGSPLAFQWSLLSRPPGSAARLANRTALTPTLDVDLPGAYVVRLVVNDGAFDSDPDTVTMTTSNALPVANAGPDQVVTVGTTVALTAQQSSDVDGDLLTPQWALLVTPPGSTATMAAPTAVNPTFVADRDGVYVAQLIVHDSTAAGPPATVIITTAANVLPVANAGPDQTISVSTLVQLDGSGSRDANGDRLAFFWALTTRPSGSKASLSDPTAPNPTFAADVAGTYVAQLIVNDGSGNSTPDTVVLSTGNLPPMANAGPDQTVTAGALVQLHGNGSHDANSDALTFAWAFIFVPSGSTASLSDASSANPTFTLDVPGTYVVQLLVNDGTLTSAPDSVVITASPTTLLALSLPLTLTVPLGQTTAIPVTLAAPAPAGGIVVNLSSNDPALIAVTTPTVTIPSGALSVNGMIQGGAVGTTTITASHADFVADTTQATTTSTDLFFTPRGTTLDASVPTSITVQLQSAGSAIAAPSSVTVALQAADPACVAVSATATIRGGLVNAVVPLSYGGSASLPCSTTVTANAPNFTPDSVSVTVNPTPAMPAITLSGFPLQVGAGLQGLQTSCCFVSLGVSNHPGTVVHLESSDPSLALVAPDSNTPGQAAIDVSLLPAQTGFSFVVQGREDVTGQVTLTASAPGFLDATGTLTVVQPTLSIVALNTSMLVSAPNNDFFVGVGIPDSSGTFLQEFQPARAGGEGFTATLGSSNVRIGQLVTTATTGQSVTVQIAAGDIFSPFGLTAGGVAFDPLRRGTTTVSATINNFIPTSQTSVEVTVGGPGLQMIIFSPRVGAGLQTSLQTPCCSVVLNDANHGGVTVRVTSSNQNVLLLAPDDNTVGTAFIDVPVPNGQTTFFFVVQGRERVTGTVTLTASATGFAAGTGTITVEQPALALFRLFLSTTLSANEVFQVGVGLPDTSRTSLQTVQAARQGGGGLLATITNSEAAVGQLTTAATTGQTVTVAIDEGQFFSLSDGVAFDPLTSGTTIVAASIPDFIATSQAMVQVTVDAPHVLLLGLPTTVGAGLQTFCCHVNLNHASEHGGVTVRVASSAPSVVLVAPDAVTPGAAFIDVFVPNGQTNVPFAVQGVERSRGTALVTASAPGFVNATGTVTVEQAALVLSGLVPQTTSTSSDGAFEVTVGLPDGNNFGLRSSQEARVGGGGITATLTSSDAGAGQLVTTASTGRQVSIQIPEGAVSSPSTVALGGVAFEPVATGATTVSAGVPGFFAPNAASQRVRVTP